VATQPILPERLPDYTGDLVSEACLIRRLVDGSEDALAHLYCRHGAAVMAEATRTSRDRWIAAEVVQETFLALWNRAELFDPSRGLLRSWLLTIAHNRAVDYLRRTNRHDRAATFSSFGGGDEVDASTMDWLAASGQPIAAARPEPGPETLLYRKETRASIADAVASLAPVERSVIALAYDGGLSQSEIADRLGWPIGTVKTRTRSALRHLRDRLERSGGDVQARGADARVRGDGPRALHRSSVRPPASIPTTSACCA
jgi:RNA polymerase sigma-70 factor (ECF subfamily)